MRRPVPLPPGFASAPFIPADALAAGVSEGRLRARDLHRPFHGVVSTRVPVSLAERCAAYQQRMPSIAFFSHVTAALLYGAPLAFEVERTPQLHVSTPKPSRALVTRGVLGHSVQLMGDDRRNYRGLRVGSPERTFCDLGAMLSVADLVAVGDHLIQWRLPLTTATRLADAVARYPGRRGIGTLRAAIARLDERSESRRESILRVVLADAGITGFLANYEIAVPGKLYRADLAHPELRVAIEYQSDYHADIEQFRRDMTRKSRLRAAGWYVIEVNADDLDDPAELAARILTELDRRRRGAS